MFANLFGKQNPVKREPDKIWHSRQLQYVGLLNFLEALNHQTTRVLLIAHFPATFRTLSGLLTVKAVPFKTYTTLFDGLHLREMSEYQPAGHVLLAMAAALPNALSSSSRSTTACDFEITILAVEHHPLPRFDDHIAEFAASLPCPSQLGFHEALDSALLRFYGGDQIARLMSSLHIPDTEFISNPHIDRSIRAAQEKISRQVSSPMATDSAEQWFQLHLP